MPRRRIDRFLNEALESFSHWLKTAVWWGKEHDYVNLFAHKFLFERIEPGAAIEEFTQVCIECALSQPEKFKRKSVVKDLVIWQRPMQTTWSETWEPIHSPKAVMEWKVFRNRLPKAVFNSHDEDWISSYTEEQPRTFGYLVSVDLASDEPAVYWKQAKQGAFSKVRSA